MHYFKQQKLEFEKLEFVKILIQLKKIEWYNIT